MTSVRTRFGRPELYTSYKQDMALLNTTGKKVFIGVLLVIALVLPFSVDDDVLQLFATGCAASIGAIGLNIVTGYAGQVSLGHAFFVAIGAYTAAALSGDPDGRVLGLGVTEVPVWLLAAGTLSAVAGALVAPLAVRLRGLYLAIVTLGLVFIGQWLFREWTDLAGPPDIGRPAPVATLFGARIDQDSPNFTRVQQLYLLMLVLLVVFALLARNLVRSRTGRAFAAIRDRDIAAAVIGVNLTRYKVIAFAISSFYAGVAGALLYVIPQTFTAGNFNLLLSVQFIAMILIGGVATISGSIMGAMFITLLPRITSELPGVLPFIGEGGVPVHLVESILYGLLIIGFLLFEPRGLFGIWIRVRNYWKAWPFSY
ncbi:MAG TPA: branched-chain amino acid ABC transporter permease [Actinophytocola sp.]|uniref:branched-chain amino acid ABC transporter permease n=1 Tax=Actinophytocola sp. TaxID=1872138 RepID=UPI002DDCF356|nr:branched-chain amino acid ABC transporter permease [Actinophytocola sp.]HEV2782926.1 branched-chain amino acid ABC transporter permease [Actinophytocola sp.]